MARKRRLQAGGTRREFLQGTTAAAVAAAAGALASAPPVHAAGNEIIRVGLIGCGNRGTGAAEQCARADKAVRITALGDMFADRIERCVAQLKEPLGEQFAVKDDCRFTGFDNYKHVIDSGVDLVLLAAPPGFRPAHIQYAVDKGKHIFAEKPVAVDAPGVRTVFKACAAAKEKKLAVVSGLCWRYHHGMRDTFAKIHDGDIGDIVALQCTYNTGELWHRSLREKQEKNWSDMEWQIRNWLYFTWLSGDHNVEQHIHSLDKMAWAMQNQYPLKAVGMGGRQVRTDPDFGHIFDHHAVVYEFASGVRCYSFCRQQENTHKDVSDDVFGLKGHCRINAGIGEGVITYRDNGRRWSSRAVKRPRDDMYQNEHDELIAGIKAGRPNYDGDWMTKSTLMAIMGRMATYTGQEISWDKALNSQEDLMPKELKLGPASVPPVARPGVTAFR